MAGDRDTVDLYLEGMPLPPERLEELAREVEGGFRRYLEVERVWPLVNEAVANRYFHDLEEMMEVVAERCRVLENAPETLRRHTLFHWWPRTRDSA